MNLKEFGGRGRKLSLLQPHIDPLTDSSVDKLIGWLPKYSDEIQQPEVSVDAEMSRLLKTGKMEVLLPLARLMFFSKDFFPVSFVQDSKQALIKGKKASSVQTSENNAPANSADDEGSENIDEQPQLANVPIETFLRDKQRLRVLLNTKLRTVNMDEIFADRDLPCDQVYFILRGKVAALSCSIKTKKHPDGYRVIEHFEEKHIVRVYNQGQVVADLEAIYNDRRIHPWMALENSQLLAIPADIYNTCFGEDSRQNEFPVFMSLKNSGAFDNWPVTNLAFLCRLITKQSKTSGELIYKENTPADEFYILCTGEATMLQLPLNPDRGEGTYLVKVPQHKPTLYQTVRFSHPDQQAAAGQFLRRRGRLYLQVPHLLVCGHLARRRLFRHQSARRIGIML